MQCNDKKRAVAHSFHDVSWGFTNGSMDKGLQTWFSMYRQNKINAADMYPKYFSDKGFSMEMWHFDFVVKLLLYLWT